MRRIGITVFASAAKAKGFLVLNAHKTAVEG